MANGHPEAQFYPVGRVWEEASIIVARQNGLLQTEAILMNQAVSAVIDEKASIRFKSTIKALGDGNGG